MTCHDLIAHMTRGHDSVTALKCAIRRESKNGFSTKSPSFRGRSSYFFHRIVGHDELYNISKTRPRKPNG